MLILLILFLSSSPSDRAVKIFSGIKLVLVQKRSETTGVRDSAGFPPINSEDWS